MDMRIVDVVTNLINYDSYDFKHYPLSEDEAKCIIEYVKLTGGYNKSKVEFTLENYIDRYEGDKE